MQLANASTAHRDFAIICKIIACSRYDIIGCSSRPGIIGQMRVPLLPVLLLALIGGCASQSSVKPVEVLDERTGVTLAALKSPIELVPGAINAELMSRKRATFAYLGPVEWNRSGAFSYGLWVHIAPGNDRQPGDIQAPGALRLTLDDGPLSLSLIEAPKLGRDAYQRVASWGQSAYFDLSVAALRRMAASRKLELEVRAVDGSVLSFSPTLDTRAALTEYVLSRGITGD
jgi:hypothetical protein